MILPQRPIIHFIFLILTLLFTHNSYSKEYELAICGSEVMISSAVNPKDLGPIPVKDLVDKEKVYKALIILANELKTIVESSKDNVLEKSFNIFSEHASNYIGSTNNFYLKLLSRVNESIKELKTHVSFSARISILPEKLCQKMYDSSLRRRTQLNEMVTKRQKIDISHTVKYSTLDFNRNENSAWYAQKINKIEGINFNVNYKVDLNKKNIPSTQNSNPFQYKLEVSGGLIISVPRHFTFPLEIPLYLQNLPTLILKSAFFEYSPQYPDRKHYVTMNIEKVEFSDKGMSFINNSISNKTPEIHVYFGDEVHYELLFESQFIHFVPSLERPTSALLGDIVFEKCDQISKQDPRSFFATACDHSARINLSLDHLVLDFIPTTIKETSTSTPTPVLLPHLRAPNENKGEVGGIRLLPRHYNPAGNRQDRKEFWLSKYLYFNKNSLIRPVFDQALEIVNLSLKNNAIGALSVMNEIKKSISLDSKGEATNDNTDDESKNESTPFLLPKRTHDISNE